MLDETQLQPGKLEAHGIEGVMHISNLIRKQQLNVNFKFYTIDYNANIPVLIFSEGKSMFPVSFSFSICLRPYLPGDMCMISEFLLFFLSFWTF